MLSQFTGTSRSLVRAELSEWTSYESGNTCLIVVVVFYTKYVWATPAKEHTAHTVATALFTFFCTFGVYDECCSIASA